MKSHKDIFTDLVENTKALKALKSLVKNEKKAKQDKDPGEYIDYIYTKFEKEITKIEKKYSLGLDELGELLMKL